MLSRNELIDFVQDILEEVAIGDPHYSHDYRLPFFRDASQLAAGRILARWPHIAGPERVEPVDRVVDERCVLCRYPDPLETGCTACRSDATNPEEGTR